MAMCENLAQMTRMQTMWKSCKKVFRKNDYFYSIILLLLIAFFYLYSTSFYKSEWLFNFNNQTQILDADVGTYLRELKEPQNPFGDQIKHLLYRYINRGVYYVGTVVLRIIPNDEIYSRLSIIFPFSIMGALAVVAFFIFLTRYTKSNLTALFFTLLFGFSTSQWIFSSIPETYTMQGFLTVLFIAYLFKLKAFEIKEILLLSFLTSLLIFVGFNNILLIPVATLFICLNKKTFSGILFILITCLIVFSAYGIAAYFISPDLNITNVMPWMHKYVQYYTNEAAMTPVNKLILTSSSFILLDIGAIQAPQKMYSLQDVLIYYFESTTSFLFLITYALVIWMVITNLFTNEKIWKIYRKPMITLGFWMLLLMAFYAYFNAPASLLYSVLFLVPYLTFLFLSLFGTNSASEVIPVKIKYCIFIMLLIITFINNIRFISAFLS